MKALLPSGAIVELRRTEPGRFTALIDAESAGVGEVTYILIDRAHNISRITVDPR